MLKELAFTCLAGGRGGGFTKTNTHTLKRNTILYHNYGVQNILFFVIFYFSIYLIYFLILFSFFFYLLSKKIKNQQITSHLDLNNTDSVFVKGTSLHMFGRGGLLTRYKLNSTFSRKTHTARIMALYIDIGPWCESCSFNLLQINIHNVVKFHCDCDSYIPSSYSALSTYTPIKK